MTRTTLICAAAGACALATGARAITITLGQTAPTYTGFSLNFDEPGTPTGSVSPATWQGSHGVVIQAGTGNPDVGAFQPFFGAWLGEGNAIAGPFGLFMNFDTDLTGLSMQVWDPSGAPSPFGGGLGVFVFNNGVEIASGSFTPAWGGVGNQWLHVSGGEFDDVRVLGFGFSPTTYGDNLSWDVVPAPSAAALLGVAGLVGARRRRSN